MSGNNGDFVEKLKHSIDIVDVISEYIPLKKSGNNYKGLCPFHQEKTPSFSVNSNKQFYYCFGCGTGGDVINFVMEIENTTFKETLKILADRAGLVIPSFNNPYLQKKRAERERIFQINKLTAKFYHFILMKSTEGENAINYLEKRGYNKKDLKRFYLGYAPDKWQSLEKFLLKRGFKDDELLKAGVISQGKNGHYYDRFRNRIIFPIFNIRGEVIAFGGRVFSVDESAPKYLNSPETLAFKKSEILYGLNLAKEDIRRTGNAIIMEGYTDVITAQKYGIKNTIASLGTSFTIEQSRLLKRYASNIYISYDADAAGAKATLRGLDIVSNEGLNVRVIQLPSNSDPDEFIKREGKSGFEKLLDDAVILIDFKIAQIAMNYDCSKVDNKINFTKELIHLIAGIKDTVERDIHIQNIAEKYNIEIGTLKRGMRSYLKDKDSKKKDKNYNYRYTKKDNKTQGQESINKVEGLILKLYIDNPRKRKALIDYLNPVFFTGNYKKLVKIININPGFNIDQLLNIIEEDNVRKLLLSLSVIDIRNLDKPKSILEKFVKKIKRDIYIKLQVNQDLALVEVNELLVKFINLTF